MPRAQPAPTQDNVGGSEYWKNVEFAVGENFSLIVLNFRFRLKIWWGFGKGACGPPIPRGLRFFLGKMKNSRLDDKVHDRVRVRGE